MPQLIHARRYDEAVALLADTYFPAALAVGETVILLHPPLRVVGVSIWVKRGCQ